MQFSKFLVQYIQEYLFEVWDLFRLARTTRNVQHALSNLFLIVSVQNPVSKLVLNPEVDEKVCKVVYVDDEVEVTVDGFATEECGVEHC